MRSLTDIVRERDLVALEHFCIGKTYREVRETAEKLGIDLDELEELLGRI